MSLRVSRHTSGACFPSVSKSAIAAALGLLVLPYWVNLGASSIWDANEAFYACTPREMIERGDYLAPTFNYEVRAQKPPLTYWFVAAAYHAFGVGEFAVRFPGALAATGTVLLAFAMTLRVASPAAALLAASVAATTPRIFVLARRLPIDILLIFFLTATAFFLWRAAEDGSRRNWSGVYLFAGLGFLTKGPVAAAIPLGAYLLWAVWTRRFSLRACRPLLGALILAPLILPWYVTVYLRHGWTYISPFLLRDNLGRFAGETLGPERGPFFYVPAFAADFFPWSVLAFGLMVVFARQWRDLCGRLRKSRFGFPVVWCALTFVLFSASQNKQEYYIAPVYPLLAVLLAAGLERSIPPGSEAAQRARGIWSWCLASLALAFLAAGAGVGFFAHLAFPDSAGVLHYVVVAVLCATAAVLGYSAVSGRSGLGIASVCGAAWLMLAIVSVVVLPAIEEYRPVRELCRRIATEARGGDAVGYYGAAVPSMAFYLRRPIFEDYDVDAVVRRLQSPQRVFCLMTEADYNELVGNRDLVLHILDRRPRLVTQLRTLLDNDRWSERELLLVSNQPASASREEGRP